MRYARIRMLRDIADVQLVNDSIRTAAQGGALVFFPPLRIRGAQVHHLTTHAVRTHSFGVRARHFVLPFARYLHLVGVVSTQQVLFKTGGPSPLFPPFHLRGAARFTPQGLFVKMETGSFGGR